MAPKITVNGRNAGEYDDLAVHRTLTVNGMDLYKLLNSGLSQLVPGATVIYLFNEGTGQILRDYSGNGYDGTLGAGAAAPTWTAEGLSFDGGDSVVCGVIPALASGNPYTVQVVVKFDDDTLGVPFATSTGAASTGKAGMIIQKSTANKIEFIQYDADAAQTQRYRRSTDIITAGEYYAITAVYDGAAITLYMGAVATDALATGYTPAPAQAVTLGRNSYYASGHLTGDIAACAAYPFALSPTQIQQNVVAIDAMLTPRGIDINL